MAALPAASAVRQPERRSGPDRAQGPWPTKCLKDASFPFSSMAGLLPPFSNANSLRACQNSRAGKTDEQSVLDNAGYRGQPSREKRSLHYSPQMGVDNPVAAIGDKNVTVPALPEHHLPGIAGFRKCLADGALRRGEAERSDLDRQRKAAEGLDP